MRKNTHRRVFALRLALLGVLLQAFWPLLAQLNPQPQSLVAGLCTVSGFESSPAHRGGMPVPDYDRRVPQCAFCGTIAGNIAPPPLASHDAVRAAELADVLPVSRESVARMAIGGFTFYSRAPPAFS